MTARGAIILAGGLFLAVACGSASLSRKNMSDNERLLRAKCRSCHVLPQPRDLVDDKWDTLLGDHRDRIALTESEIQRLIEYLQQNN